MLKRLLRYYWKKRLRRAKKRGDVKLIWKAARRLKELEENNV